MLRTIDRQFTLVVIAIFLIGTATIFAQSNPQPDQAAPVLLDGRTVFYVRAAVKQLTPEARAKGIADRMQRLASDRYFDPNTIAVVDTDISSDIVAGDSIITLVFDGDAQAEGRGERHERVQSGGVERRRRGHRASVPHRRWWRRHDLRRRRAGPLRRPCPPARARAMG